MSLNMMSGSVVAWAKILAIASSIVIGQECKAHVEGRMIAFWSPVRIERVSRSLQALTVDNIDPAAERDDWTLYRQSDRWLGNPAIGEDGLADSTRDARTGLIESLIEDNGE